VARRLTLDISETVWAELVKRRSSTGEDYSTIVEAALTEAFDIRRHSLFQVSTSNALVQGVFSGVLTVAELKRHGDLGLGTFAGLDGELVMVDGECMRATAGGVVGPADDDREIPFALVTNFRPDSSVELSAVEDVVSLQVQLDQSRPSQNLFTAIRIDGSFDTLTMRAACPAGEDEGLLAATKHQSEFSARDVVGSLVGFWAPEYSQAISIPGYHFHFLSADRSLGGHVLDLTAASLRADIQLESDLHLAIPGTEDFLTADLSGKHLEALNEAETGRAGQAGPV
jgi:acetolactate decarboxylase